MSNPASEAARLLGQMKSEKKAAASRQNGQKGGSHVVTEEMKQRISEAQKRRWAARKALQAQSEEGAQG